MRCFWTIVRKTQSNQALLEIKNELTEVKEQLDELQKSLEDECVDPSKTIK